MKFLQQLEPLVEAHTTAIEENLSESSVITALDRLRKYTARDIADFAFFHFMTLMVLNTSVDYATAVNGYVLRTQRTNNFDKLSFVGTDLNLYLHLLLGGSHDKLRKTPANDVFWRRCHLSQRGVHNLLVWLRSDLRVASKGSRFCLDLEKNLQIETANYRSIRRVVAAWDSESTHNQRLAVTRLLMAMRSRCPRSDLLVHLEAFAKDKNLEQTDVKNPEVCKHESK